jgi:FkbH-like protein
MPENAESPLDTVFRLRQAGRLTAEFPRVAGLVADLPDSELVRAGRLLGHIDPDEVRRAHPAVPVLTVAVTGHGTLAPLLPALTAEFTRHSMVARLFVGGFSSYVTDLGDPGSTLHTAAPDLVLCLLNAAMVFEDICVPWRPDDVEQALARWTHLIDQLAGRFAAHSRATLVLNTITLARQHTAQVVDNRSRARLGVVWREANARLLGLVEKYPNTMVVDLDPLVAEGIAVTDPRLESYTATHLSPALLARYAREAGHIAASLTGTTRKCLVVDLDNTVWGGVLGDDGIDGIEVAGTYRGNAFRNFQRALKQIAAQGVLLAAVSKNDLAPVRQVLREHPGMTLREDAFVRVVANWRPKHDNITELAAALNIGTDSMVFLDDSAYECGLVRRELPAVRTIQLDDEPALHVTKLVRDGWFDTHQLTAEDRSRVEKYRTELDRQDFLDTFESVEDYLHELGVTVRLAPAAPVDVVRVSQLTLRTNQFNLTAERLQPAEVSDRMADPNRLVLTIDSADRFGDNGLVGVVFVRRATDVWHIDNFLLSCRVFGRGIEQACLTSLLWQAKSSGASAVYGTYRKTLKNGKVEDFYPRHGFEPDGAHTTTLAFRHDLIDIIAPPDHIKLIERVGGDAA